MWQSAGSNFRSPNRVHSQHRQQQNPSPPDLLGSSPSSSSGGADDFGSFTSAVPAYNDPFSAGRQQTSGPSTAQCPTRPIDLLTDDGDHIDSWSIDDPVGPITYRLPPRPSEITPDYVPPSVRSPRRLSSLSFPGPSSPPQVSDVVFDPFDSATTPASPQTKTHETAHAKLFNTLATTTRIASKWKSVLEPNLFSTQERSGPPTATALPIDIDHSTPFSHSERWSLPAAPPSGAPGFLPQTSKSTHSDAPEEGFHTMLRDRRPTTIPVLTQDLANQVRFSPRQLTDSQVRQYLPARQKLASTWSLLCE